jgi:hypothetical protein
LVAAPGGVKWTFVLPPSEPGSRTEGVELRLPEQTSLLPEVVNEQGEPLPLRGEEGGPFLIGATAVRSNGQEEIVWLARGGPTLFGGFVTAPAEELARLVVQAEGHEPVTHEFESPPIGRPRIPLVLERRESFRLAFRFRFADESEREALDGVNLELLARARPGRAGGDPSRGPYSDDSGARRSFRPREQPDVALRVPSRRAWFVSVRGPFLEDGRGDGEVELGSFEPDGSVREVELPRVSEAWLAARARKALAQESGADSRPPSGSCDLELVDAVSGQPIEPERIDLLRARKRGYRDSAPISVAITAGEKRDGGRILLQPLPAHRLRLLEPDGAPAAHWHVEAIDPAAALERFRDFRGFEFATSESGVATLRCELPDSFLLVASPPGADPWLESGSMPVRFEAGPWPADETLELRLPSRRTLAVDMDLRAVDPDLRGGRCEVALRVAEGSMAERAFWSRGRRALVFQPGSRRFLFTAAPGRYVVRTLGSSFEDVEQEVEIADSERAQQVSLVVPPR